MTSAASQVRQQAVQAAQKRLARAFQFLRLNATKPLFEKAMRLEGGRRVRVGLYMPGPVLVQFDPGTGVILARSQPGRLDVLDEECVEQ